MASLDDDLLARVGLGDLPDAAKASLLQTLADELERRVGTALAARLTAPQLAEFEALIEAGRIDDAQVWLETAVPARRFIATSQKVILEMELRSKAHQIRASFAAG